MTSEMIQPRTDAEIDADIEAGYGPPRPGMVGYVRRVARVTVARRRNEYGEFVVRAYDQDGRRYPEADYFTSDRDDAVGTGEAMVKQS